MYLALNVLIVLLILTGCNTNDWLNHASDHSEERIEIEFWHSMGSSNGILIQELTDEFNQSQDKIYVKTVCQGSYADAHPKFLAAVSSGETPVIAQMEIGRIGIFAAADQLVNMQTFAEEDNFLLDDFIHGLLDASYYEGELIALPHSRSLPVMYYNKDLFRKCGLNEADPPDNWKELKDAAKRLTGDGVYGYSCPLDPWYYYALMMCSGGQIYDEWISSIGFDDESGTAPLYLWKEMIEEGIMYVPFGEDYNSSETCRNLFAEGTVAMIMQSSAQLKGLKQICEFDVGVAPVPINTDKVYPAGGSNLVMFQGHSREQQRAGWEFIKFMVSAENSAVWSNGTGYLMVRQSCEESDIYKQILEDDDMQTIRNQVEYCSSFPFLPEYVETMEIIEDEIKTCILEEHYSPEEVVAHIKENVEILLWKGRYQSHD